MKIINNILRLYNNFIKSLLVMPDKLLHAIAGTAIFCVSAVLLFKLANINKPQWIALGIVIVIGFLKELYDGIKKNAFDVEDWAWTVFIGGVPCAVMLNVLNPV